MARPKKEIDREQFEELCKMQCTQSEVCSVLKVTDKTLTRWCNETYDLSYSEAYKIYAEEGRTSLRRYQWRMAEKNPTMAIWLGKQMLDQRDKPKEEDEKKNEVLDNLTEALLKAANTKNEEN